MKIFPFQKAKEIIYFSGIDKNEDFAESIHKKDFK